MKRIILSLLFFIPLVACVHDDDEGLTDFQGDGSHATTQVDDEDRIKVQTIQRSELVVEKKEDLNLRLKAEKRKFNEKN